MVSDVAAGLFETTPVEVVHATPSGTAGGPGRNTVMEPMSSAKLVGELTPLTKVTPERLRELTPSVGSCPAVKMKVS